MVKNKVNNNKNVFVVVFSVFSTVRCKHCMHVNICIGRYSLLAGLVKIVIVCQQNK